MAARRQRRCALYVKEAEDLRLEQLGKKPKATANSKDVTVEDKRARLGVVTADRERRAREADRE